MKRFLTESGSISIIVAVSLTLMLSMTALVLDVGSAYVETSKIQNAADAAALSAGTLLPVSTNDPPAQQKILESAVLYAVKNGVSDPSGVTVTFGGVSAGEYTTLAVHIPATAKLNFGGITGVNKLSLSRSATVRLSATTAINDAAPLGVEAHALEAAIASGNLQHIVLKYGGGGGSGGFFGALDLDGLQGGGAKDFSSWLCYGYGGTLKVGDVLPVESGNMAEPTNTALRTRLTQCTHYLGQGGCTPEHFVDDCPRVIKVIVYEWNGTKSVRVDGFAAFVLEGTDASGEVVGSYVRVTDPSARSDSQGNNYGMSNLQLCG